MSRATGLNISQLNPIARSTASDCGGYPRGVNLRGSDLVFCSNVLRVGHRAGGYARPLRHLASFQQRQHRLVDIPEIGTQAKCGLGGRARLFCLSRGEPQIERRERGQGRRVAPARRRGSIDLDSASTSKSRSASFRRAIPRSWPFGSDESLKIMPIATHTRGPPGQDTTTRRPDAY